MMWSSEVSRLSVGSMPNKGRFQPIQQATEPPSENLQTTWTVSFKGAGLCEM